MSLINFRVMATEEPEFTLISQENAIEVREYKPKIIARVEVEGDFDDASSKGFKLLADYILEIICSMVSLRKLA